jgi:tetratricopeptide (TPR) repeat protein
MSNQSKRQAHLRVKQIAISSILLLTLTSCGSFPNEIDSQKLSNDGKSNLHSINLGMAREFMASGRLDLAIKHLSLAIKDGFGDEDTFAVRGNCNHMLGYLDAATADYQQARKYNPTNATALIGLADISIRKSQPAVALEFCKNIPLANQSTKMLLTPIKLR